MKARSYWKNIVCDWFDKLELPEKRVGWGMLPSSRSPETASALIEVAIRSGCTFRGSALCVDEECLVVYEDGRPVGFVDWDEIAGLRVVYDPPDALWRALSDIGDVVGRLSE